MADFVPSADADFNTWFPRLVEIALKNAVLLKMSAEEQTALSAALTAWIADYAAQQTAQNAATAATNTKNAARAAAEGVIREQVAQWQKNPAVTDDLRAQLAITIASGTRTAAPVPTSRPVLSADTSQRLQITIDFMDAGATSKAKPASVRGCQVWMQISGAPPLDTTGMSYLATDTRTPYTANFDAADAGKTVYFIGLWENTKGETGPLSDVLRAIIPG